MSEEMARSAGVVATIPNADEEEGPQLTMEEIAAIEDAMVTRDGDAEPEPSLLTPGDRAMVVSFFDGTGAPQLLLEGTAPSRLPDFLAPNLLSGFPSGFPGLSQDDAVRLLRVVAAFNQTGPAPAAKDKTFSTEVRQSIAVDGQGFCVLRKTISINGKLCSSEEQSLQA
jgi:hypothetical protein